MADSVEMVVLVKAAPVLTHDLAETMCVAGARVDSDAVTWLRLHPVPFRDVAEPERFVKYQTVRARVITSKTDRRPESRTPLHGSIEPGERLGTANGWAARRDLVDRLGEANMCDLWRRNQTGSGPGTPSLAVVRPAGTPELVITRRDPEQLATWQRRAEGANSLVSLFDDPTVDKPDFEVVPWRFQYRYRCRASDCSTLHTQTIVDWEIVALWRRVRHHGDWQDRMRAKFVDELWTDRDAALFVGNQEQHPISFLILGVFWPPATPQQGVLQLRGGPVASA